jgi:hypothetical protein
MERVVEEVKWSTRAVNADIDPSTQLDWNKLMNGQVWRLVKGLDYAMQTDSMASNIYARGRKEGRRVRVKTNKLQDPENLIIQFMP